MERYFILDKLNTWHDLRLILTAKDIPDAEPKTNYVALDGMSGTLDLSEALTGEVTYNDRTLTAKFWTDYGKREDREALFRKISASLQGKKVRIVEPDDPNHYFYGRVKIKSKVNNLAYAEITLELICEPWRYTLEETSRRVDVNSSAVTSLVIHNNGVKTLTPVVTVTGSVSLAYDGLYVPLTSGTYKLSAFKLRQGANVIEVSGSGSATFKYREATL